MKKSRCLGESRSWKNCFIELFQFLLPTFRRREAKNNCATFLTRCFKLGGSHPRPKTRNSRNVSFTDSGNAAGQPFKYDPVVQTSPSPNLVKQKEAECFRILQFNMEPTLPYANVDLTLRGLAGQAEGFGRLAIGGRDGPVYHVTTLSDDGPGSLRDGCRRKEPLWIVFDLQGVIHLRSSLSVSSYKTIDGRGKRVKLTGNGLRLKQCEHIIICNLEFEGGRGPDVDAIQIKPNSKNIWIDRCSLRDYDDGLIDITRESTDITVSRCHFSHHNKTMLIGADSSHTSDRCIRVTIHHCFFDGTHQRHPRVRFGRVHLYNNYTRNWGIYAVCASLESQIYSQCNIYEAGTKKVAFKYLIEKAADKEEAESGYIKSDGDLFEHETQTGLKKEDGEFHMFDPKECYATWTTEAPTDALKQILQLCAGWQDTLLPAEQASTALRSN